MNSKMLSITLLAGTLASASFAHAGFNIPVQDAFKQLGTNHVLQVADDSPHNEMAMKVHKVGPLEIHGAFARATLPNAPVSGGYLTIKNTGDEADRLIGGKAGFAAKVEVHEMMMKDDVMKMRKLEDGVEIPAGGEVMLKPGGYHIMFMKLSERLMAGEMRKVTLQFEKAGSVELDFPVKKLKAGHDKMMKHSE